MLYPRTLPGDRLYLTPLDKEDPRFIASWVEWMNDQSVADQYGGHHQLFSPDMAKETVAGLEGYRFAIVLLDDDELIGHISLHDLDHINRSAFLGIVIGSGKHRGHGYGTDAIQLVLNYGFNTLNLHAISLTLNEDNIAGITCYKRVGFREVGRRRECVFRNGKYIDKIYMDILAREFQTLCATPRTYEDASHNRS